LSWYGAVVKTAKMTNAQTLAGIAVVLVVVGILLVVIGMPTGTTGLAIFGGVIIGLAVIVGVVGLGMNAFRR
jgi:hypothetical protein